MNPFFPNNSFRNLSLTTELRADIWSEDWLKFLAAYLKGIEGSGK